MLRSSKDKTYQPPRWLEVPGGRNLVEAITPKYEQPKVRSKCKPPKKKTPLGQYIKRYCMLYNVTFAQLAELMASIDREWCRGITEADIDLWAQRGQMPTVFQFQTLCYILGVKNPWVLRPRGCGGKFDVSTELERYENPEADELLTPEDLTDGQEVRLPIEATLEKQAQMEADVKKLHGDLSAVSAIAISTVNNEQWAEDSVSFDDLNPTTNRE